MRVALLSDWYLPRRGGIELHLADLAARLAARGHQVDVITATPAPGPGPPPACAPLVGVSPVGSASGESIPGVRVGDVVRAPVGRGGALVQPPPAVGRAAQIGRASCRERV